MWRVYIYLAIGTNWILHDECIFAEVHLEQEEGWRLDRAAIAI